MQTILDNNLNTNLPEPQTKWQAFRQWMQKSIQVISGIIMFCSGACLALFLARLIYIGQELNSNPLLPSYLFKVQMAVAIIEILIVTSAFLFALAAYRKQKVRPLYIAAIIFVCFMLFYPFIEMGMWKVLMPVFITSQP